MAALKPKVVLVGPTRSYFKGGIVHYSQCLLAEFKRQKYPVKLIGFSRGYPKRFFPGVVTVNSPLSKKSQFGNAKVLEILDWLNPWSWYSTAKTIAQDKPQIVVWQWWTWFWTVPFFATIWLLKKLTKAKIVIIAHNPFDHEQALYKQWGSHLVLSQADLLLVPNKEMLKNLQQLFPDKAIRLAYHPLYTFFSRPKKVSQKVRVVKLPSPLLLFFGHVRHYKGLGVLLHSLNQLWEQGKKVNLLVVGEFWEDKQQYLDLIKPKFRPFVQIVDRYVQDTEVATYFDKADAVVIPYLYGSGSGPAKIALAFNKPLVATKVADNPDLFRLARIGEMVKPNSSKQLFQAISQVLANPGKYRAEIAKIKPLLSWKNLVNKIVQ